MSVMTPSGGGGAAATGLAATASASDRAAVKTTTRTGPLHLLMFLTICLLFINLSGASYYLAPLADRLRHPLHAWLKPSGYVGQPLGFVAVILFLALWLYPIRKKFGTRLAVTGTIAGWLDWHISFGLLVPWLAATHSAWRFTGMIGLGFSAMFIVYLSGIAGRYLYVRIPRKRDGLELSLDEATAERERLLFELTAATGLPPGQVRELLAPDAEGRQGQGFVRAFATMLSDDFARHRAARELSRRLAGRRKNDPSPMDQADLKRVLQLARHEMALAQQVRMLDVTHQALRHWHIFHKPLAVTALVAVVTHVVVAVLFSATWLG